MRYACLCLILSIFIAGVAFAQPTAPSRNGTAFDQYCYDNCFAVTDDSRCENLCLTSPSELTSFCGDYCKTSGGSDTLCGLGCNLLLKKRTDLGSCFNSCMQTGSNESCDTKCNVTSTVKTIVTTIGMAVKQNTSLENAILVERSISGLFPDSTVAMSLGKEILVEAGGINYTNVGGVKTIRIPVGLGEGDKLDSLVDSATNITIENDAITIPIPAKAGGTVARIIAQTDGIVGKDGIGEGEIRSISLKTDPVKATFSSTVNGTFSPPEVTVDATLNDIPSSATLDVKSTVVSASTLDQFESLAKDMNLTITDQVIAVEIAKENISKQDVAHATIRMKVDKAWVASIGGIGALRIARADNGKYEILNTYVVGEEDGMLIIEGDSPNGLSLYAMVTVGVTAPTGETGRITVSPGQGSGINPLIIGGILLVVIAAVYFFVLKKPQKPQKK